MTSLEILTDRQAVGLEIAFSVLCHCDSANLQFFAA